MVNDVLDAIKPPPPGNNQDEFAELEDDNADRIKLVALPTVGGGLVYIKQFDKKILFKRFRSGQQKEKAAWTKEMQDHIKAVIGDNVMLSRMTYDLWRQLNVPREMGRELSSE